MTDKNETAYHLQWNPLTPDASFSVFSIAEEIHTELGERREVFEEKITLAPSFCRGLYADTTLVGYGIAHPWTLYSIPPLDSFIHDLPVNPTCVYIHDVALLPEMRGKGAASEYIHFVKEQAKKNKIDVIALVSVYGTDVFWKKYGFTIMDSRKIESSLSAYGTTARYMICTVLI